MWSGPVVSPLQQQALPHWPKGSRVLLTMAQCCPPLTLLPISIHLQALKSHLKSPNCCKYHCKVTTSQVDNSSCWCCWFSTCLSKGKEGYGIPLFTSKEGSFASHQSWRSKADRYISAVPCCSYISAEIIRWPRYGTHCMSIWTSHQYNQRDFPTSHTQDPSSQVGSSCWFVLTPEFHSKDSWGFRVYHPGCYVPTHPLSLNLKMFLPSIPVPTVFDPQCWLCFSSHRCHLICCTFP